MIARGFKSVGWVAAVAGAALSCYMLSLQVASERAELAGLERRIIAARQDIRTLQTELGTRGRLQQLERWNAEVLALSAPVAGQFLDNPVMLARFDLQPRSFEDRTRVRLASAEQTTAEAQPAPRLAALVEAPEPQTEPQRPIVHRAALVVTEEPAPRPARQAPAERRPEPLLGEQVVAAISDAARSERTSPRDGAADD